MAVTWELQDVDKQFFERELQSFVPDRVYDMHAHLWRVSDWEGDAPDIVKAGPSELTMERYKEAMEWIFPKREVHGLHFAFPTCFPSNTEACNSWVSQEIAKDPLARGQFYVRPTDDPEMVRSEMKRLGLRGFKPFVSFIQREDKENAEVPEYFPEWIPRLAHEENWSVTLHMQKARSLADPSNQHWIRTYCEKYPSMTLILDHCARGFNPYHAIEGLAKMQGLPNLYADTSAVCSPAGVCACLKFLGVSNVLYGSDIFCSHMRGTNLPIGDSFVWIEGDSPVWYDVEYAGKPVLLGLENLRATKLACEMMNLSDKDVEDIFWNNAARILGF